jgi:hypothetical protein
MLVRHLFYFLSTNLPKNILVGMAPDTLYVLVLRSLEKSEFGRYCVGGRHALQPDFYDL